MSATASRPARSTSSVPGTAGSTTSRPVSAPPTGASGCGGSTPSSEEERSMSADERAHPTVVADAATADAPLAADARRILEQVRRILDEDRVGEVPDQAAQDLLLAAV